MERYIFNITDTAENSTYRLRHTPNGWEDYGVSFGRETDISNVVKSYSGSWEFYKEDGDYIWLKFATHGPNRLLKLTILALEDAMAGRYRKEYVGYLDLTQIQRSNGAVSVPVSEGGFFKALENKWSEDFSIPYDSFLNVNGNVFSETAHFTSPDSVSGQIQSGHSSLFGYILTGGQIQNDDEISDVFFKTTNLQHIRENDRTSLWNSPTLLSSGNATLVTQNRVMQKVTVSWDINLRYYIDGMQLQYACAALLSTAKLYLVSCPITDTMTINKNYTSQIWHEIDSVDVTSEVRDNNVGGTNKTIINPSLKGDVEMFDFVCSSEESDRYAVFMIIELRYGRQLKSNGESVGNAALSFPGGNYNVRFNLFDVSITHEQVINNGKYVSVIPSERVFRSLIDKINGSRYNVTVSTSDFLAVAGGDVLTSAPGMRYRLATDGTRRYQAVGGSITTNLGEFLKYCYAVYGFRFGVDYDIEADSYRVFLAHSDNMYSDTEICRLERVSNVTFSVWRDVLYSSITLGHEKDDNAINSDRDFNCIYTLSTPNTEIEQNVLEIVSPYSASTRTFETELYNDYNADRNVEDGQIYVIDAKPEQTSSRVMWQTYSIRRDIMITAGALFPKEEYNVKFSPKRMLLNHISEINGYMAFEDGKTIDVLTCDGNREIVAGGISEQQPVTIGGQRKFKPVVVTADSIGDGSIISKIAANRLGYFSFELYGRRVKGYIAHSSNAVTIRPMKEDASEFAMLMADDSGGMS